MPLVSADGINQLLQRTFKGVKEGQFHLIIDNRVNQPAANLMYLAMALMNGNQIAIIRTAYRKLGINPVAENANIVRRSLHIDGIWRSRTTA